MNQFIQRAGIDSWKGIALSSIIGLASISASFAHHIGDLVWHDQNRNGIQDSGEPGIPGVTVKAFNQTNQSLVATASTDSSGKYLMEFSSTIEVYLVFSLPEGYQFTGQNQGSNDNLDSDADPIDGRTQSILLDCDASAGCHQIQWDAGLVREEPLARACEEFVTGGGWTIDTPSGKKANFRLKGGIKDGGAHGQLNYVDHGDRLHVKASTATAYQVLDNGFRLIEYAATVNNIPCTATVLFLDSGEPGRNDVLTIELSNGDGVLYQAGGTLGGSHPGGGNLQLHRKGCE